MKKSLILSCILVLFAAAPVFADESNDTVSEPNAVTLETPAEPDCEVQTVSEPEVNNQSETPIDDLLPKEPIKVMPVPEVQNDVDTTETITETTVDENTSANEEDTESTDEEPTLDFRTEFLFEE